MSQITKIVEIIHYVEGTNKQGIIVSALQDV